MIYIKIMKRLSDETFQLIQQLYQPPTWLKNLWGKQETPFSLLERIEKSAEPLAIPNLLSFAIRERNEYTLAAARTIHNLLGRHSVKDLALLDEHTRICSPYFFHFWAWNDIQPDDLENLSHFQDFQVSILGVGSFHNNGFVREKAVKELSDIFTGKELPYLLIRLNDWVPNVQEIAFAAVAARLRSDYAAYFVDCLALVVWLSKRNRIDQGSMVGSIEELLKTESSYPALLNGLNSQDRYIRRACFRIAFDANAMDRTAIIERGSKDKDILIRLWSVQKVKGIKEAEKITYLLGIFRHDPYMPVRREALRIYIEKFPEQALDQLRLALLDSHFLMRDEARYQIKKRYAMDFAAFYRNSLAQGNEICSAISGLGETGSVSDESFILPYVHHPLTRIRRVSIKALEKINPIANTDLFLQVLFDPSASVSREAANALKTSKHFVNSQRLWNDLERASQPHVKANLLFLIADLPKWESIFYLIKAASSDNEFVSTIAYQKISYWQSHFNGSFIPPTASQKTNLLRLLADDKNPIDTNVRQGIEFFLKSM